MPQGPVEPRVALEPLLPEDPEFARRLLRYWMELGARPDPRWAEQYVRRLAAHGPERLNFWGLWQSRRVGFALLRLDTDWVYPERRTGYVAEFTVFPEFRRRGLGTALFASVRERFRQEGCMTIELDVLPTNGVGMLFWRKQGLVLAYHRLRQWVDPA